MKVQRRVGLLGLLLATTFGCSPATPADALVRWLLADGRSCIDAAVVRVSITTSAPGDPLLSPCPAAPLTDPRILIPGLTPGMQVRGSGLSGSGTVLYRGELTVPDPVTPGLDLTLYFTAGK